MHAWSRSLRSARAVLEVKRNVEKRYFPHEPYLRMVRATFGESTEAHIRQMTAHRLERANLGA